MSDTHQFRPKEQKHKKVKFTEDRVEQGFVQFIRKNKEKTKRYKNN